LTIDPQTGLQKVPDDMFWRVETYDRRGVPGVSLHLRKKFTRTIPALPEIKETKLIRNGFWANLLGKEPKTELVTYRPAEPEKVEEGDRNLISRNMEQKSKDGNKPGDGWVAGYTYNDSYNWYLVTEVTKENLAEFSQKVWKIYIDWLHSQAINIDKEVSVKAFAGDYPPKSLNESA